MINNAFILNTSGFLIDTVVFNSACAFCFVSSSCFEHATNDNKESKMYSASAVSAVPMWDSDTEAISTQSADGYGFDYHPPEDDALYENTFRKFRLTGIFLGSDEGWSDIVPPVIEIQRGFGTTAFSGASGQDGRIREGFSIDYDEGTLTLNERFYYWRKDYKGYLSHVYAPAIRIFLVKAKYIQHKDDPDAGSLPDGSESTKELSFVTRKVGTYSNTILKVLNMGNLSKQSGSTVIIGRGTSVSSLAIPSFDDTPYAKDKAYWQLSNTAHKKIKGTIKLTLDAVLFYNLNLSKRIYIQGITEYPLNIVSMNYNMADFTVNVNLESKHYYKRSVSVPSHGEGIRITSVLTGFAVGSGG